jgi:PAS domain S-box-containing protein
METEFSRLVDALPGLVWTAFPDGRAESVNLRWCNYTGMTRDEAVGLGWRSAIHPDDTVRLLGRWGDFLESGQGGEVEARLRRHDGVYRRFLFNVSPCTDDTGQIVKWCGINTDIDERRQTEEVLSAWEHRFQSIVDGLPALVTIMSPDGELERANRQVLEYFGATLSELKDQESASTIHPDDRASAIAAWRVSLESGDAFSFEGRHRRADGSYRWFHMNGYPLRDAQGSIVLWYILHIDIDERKRAETLLAGEKRLLELVALGRSLSGILNSLCKLVEDVVDGCYCSILSIDSDGARFRQGGGPSLPAAYNEVLDGLIIDRNYGPCGMAATVKTQVIAADVASDPRWKASPWPKLVIGHGFQSCWSTPILSRDEKVLGVFALYRHLPAAPAPLEEDLIRRFADIASIAMERAHSDALVRESEEHKSAILNSALDCIVVIDHDGRITEFNAAAERTFSWLRQDVLGKALAEMIIPHSLREQHRRGFARYLTTGEATVVGRRVELTAMRADGSEFPVELTVTRNPSRGPPSFTGFLRDITERRQSEDRLRRSNAYLTEAQQISATGSFLWCVDTDDITWSDQVYRMHEYPLGTLVTVQLISDRFHPDDLPLLNNMLGTARHVTSFEFEYRLQMPDGSIKHIALRAHAHRNHLGQLEYLGAVQDVTERRLAEETLDKIRSELTSMARITSLGILTASIAHEVNQPLAGIITNANTCMRMLAADPPNVTGARETARRTIRDGNRAADVIKRLRALFSRKANEVEAIDLNEAAREVVALSSNELQRNKATLQLDLADGLPVVAGDRIQLQQVILNLLLNASDAMIDIEDRRRQITIKTESLEDRSVRLSVRDAGVGFDPRDTNRFFEAFYTTKSEGMGIGLSISRSIIESHHGRMQAQTNDGPGATFLFTLPSISTSAASECESLLTTARPDTNSFLETQ